MGIGPLFYPLWRGLGKALRNLVKVALFLKRTGLWVEAGAGIQQAARGCIWAHLGKEAKGQRHPQWSLEGLLGLRAHVGFGLRA